MLHNQRTVAFIRHAIRDIPNWPEQGVIFRDISTLLKSSSAFKMVIDIFIERYYQQNIDAIVGLDARGFIFGPVVAYELGIGFIPVRKKGKLPAAILAKNYQLEYGDTATFEIHCDAITRGEQVVIIDDLIATGGTMLAACLLLTELQAKIVECAVISNLTYLTGSSLLKQHGFNLFSIVQYDD